MAAVKGAEASGAERRRRVQTRDKIRKLAPQIRDELDRRLREGRWSFRELSRWLEEAGAEISPTAINYYYRHQFVPDLNAVRVACAQTAAAIEHSGGDDEAINRKLRSLVQESMFQLLVEMNRVRENARTALESRQNADKRRAIGGRRRAQAQEQGPTRAELAALAAFARAAVAFRRSDLDQSRWEMEKARIAQQLAAAGEQVVEAARGGGLSAEAEHRIRAALMEIEI
jgi:hypothetical protein